MWKLGTANTLFDFLVLIPSRLQSTDISFLELFRLGLKIKHIIMQCECTLHCNPFCTHYVGLAIYNEYIIYTVGLLSNHNMSPVKPC